MHQTALIWTASHVHGDRRDVVTLYSLTFATFPARPFATAGKASSRCGSRTDPNTLRVQIGCEPGNGSVAVTRVPAPSGLSTLS